MTESYVCDDHVMVLTASPVSLCREHMPVTTVVSFHAVLSRDPAGLVIWQIDITGFPVAVFSWEK